MRLWLALVLVLGLAETGVAQTAPPTSTMRDAARKFLATLDPAQKSKATLPFNSEERFHWFYTPVSRKGVPLKELNASQQQAALAPRTPKPTSGNFGPNAPLSTLVFTGATECDGASGCWTPPDVAGAVSKANWISTSNDVIEIHSKGGSVLKTNSLNGFFGYSAQSMFDPRVQYDEEYQRWIVTADAFEEASNTVQIFGIAISKTSSATGAFYRYFINTNGFTGAGNFYDYPMLGLSQDAVLFTANVFTGSGFAGSSLFSVAKARLYNGFGWGVPVFTGLSGTMQAAHQNLTDQNGEIWYAAAPGNSGAIYMVYETNPANPSNTGLFGYFGVSGVPAYSIPPSAKQPAGCGGLLDTLDNRFQNQGTQSGDSYYQVHDVNDAGFPTVRYYVISGLLTHAPTVALTSLVFKSSSSNDWNPSIAADAFGRFGIDWSLTVPGSGGTNPSEMFADNNGSNPGPGSGLIVFTSASCANTSGTSRWGDYSQVSIDPGTGVTANTNTKIFWIVNETMPGVNFWSTEIAKIVY